MLAIYVNVAATVIASVNTMISAYLTNFPPQNANVKKNLIIASILMTGFAALTVVGTALREATEKSALSQKRENERQQLGTFIAEGNAFLPMFRDPNQTAPEQQANDWGFNVETYLNKQLGPSYVQRFRDGVGISHGQPVGIDQRRINYWSGIYERIVRLEQFSSEIPR